MTLKNWVVVSDNSPRLFSRNFEKFTDALHWMYLELAHGSSVALTPGPDNAASGLRLTYGNAPSELARFVNTYGRRA